MSEEDALAYWMAADKTTFVAEDESGMVGTYYMRATKAAAMSAIAAP